MLNPSASSGQALQSGVKNLYVAIGYEILRFAQNDRTASF